MTLPSGVPYTFSYDSLGNLVQLRTPAGQLHKFQTSMNMGFIRKSNTVDNQMYIEDQTAAGHVIRSIYPSEYRYKWQTIQS